MMLRRVTGAALGVLAADLLLIMIMGGRSLLLPFGQSPVSALGFGLRAALVGLLFVLRFWSLLPRPERPSGGALVRNVHSLIALGRLAPGVSIEQARADLSGISRQLESEFPESNRGWGTTVVPLMDQTVGEVRPALLIALAGVGLILLGIAFIVAEAFLPSFGALGIGGLVALVIGSIILFDPETAEGYSIPWAFVLSMTAAGAGTVFATVWFAVKARRRPVVSGREQLIGASGVVLSDVAGEVWARVGGESWRVVSAAPLVSGQKVRITGIDGLTLRVEPDDQQGEAT